MVCFYGLFSMVCFWVFFCFFCVKIKIKCGPLSKTRWVGKRFCREKKYMTKKSAVKLKVKAQLDKIEVCYLAVLQRPCRPSSTNLTPLEENPLYP